MPLAAHARLGHYEIIAAIGAGGMGEVYRARDSRLERDVAIKVLPEHLSKDPELLARFEREAKVVAALSHPNILAIYDFGTDQGVSYAVTELLEGETLGSRLSHSALPSRKALEIGIAVADGLSAAHSKEILHRDIKPENIFLTSDGRVKILDFGLARYKPPVTDETLDSLSTAPTKPAQTAWGAVMGTVGYMSPEQVCGGKLDARSDIFSLGCVIYEMLARRRAFSGRSPHETAAAILKEHPPELSKLGVEIPLGLDRVVEHCLEKNPEERFHSAHDLAFALRHILTGSSGSGLHAGAFEQRKINRTWILTGLLVFLLGAAGLFVRRPTTIDSVAVLPFVAQSADPGLQDLSDRITENLINHLSQIPKLRVSPRSSVFRFKTADVDLQKAGRDLHAHAVLTGRVVRQRDAVNIQTELVDVEHESQIWGRQYDRPIGDVAGLPALIAKQVAERLQTHQQGENQERETRQKPRELIAALQIKRGDTVGDIGAGSGFMIPYFVEAVGPKGKVIAEDIRQDLLSQVEQRAKAQGWSNVTVVQGSEKDPRLPAGALDVAFILAAYHEFEYAGEMLGHISRALKPDGRLVVVERYQVEGNPHYRGDRDRFTGEIEANGFQLASQFDHGSSQYVLVFRKKDERR